MRGFSSAGRAPALQAGGQGFDSLNLHQEGEKVRKRLAQSKYGRIAQRGWHFGTKCSAQPDKRE